MYKNSKLISESIVVCEFDVESPGRKNALEPFMTIFPGIKTLWAAAP